MAKRVKWNIHVEHEVVFPRLSLLWGFSEDVLYLDNYTMLFCFFEYWYIFVLHSKCFETFVSEIHILHISSIKLLWYKVYGIRFRSEIICSFYRITAIVLWGKPFGCEKLNKRDCKLLSRCFFHFCVSLYSLNLKTYPPQTFSVTAAVVAPADLRFAEISVYRFFWEFRLL